MQVTAINVVILKEGKLINAVKAVSARCPVIIDSFEAGKLVTLPQTGCFWPTVEDLEQHYPKELGYSVVSNQ